MVDYYLQKFITGLPLDRTRQGLSWPIDELRKGKVCQPTMVVPLREPHVRLFEKRGATLKEWYPYHEVWLASDLENFLNIPDHYSCVIHRIRDVSEIKNVVTEEKWLKLFEKLFQE